MPHLLEDRIGANDVIRVWLKSSDLCGRVGLDFEDVPDVFVGAFERTEPYTNAKQSLSPPFGSGGQFYFSHSLRFAVIDRHFQRLINTCLQNLFESVVVLILDIRQTDKYL